MSGSRWRTANYQSITDAAKENQLALFLLADGKAYCGFIQSVDQHRVELMNGDQPESVYYLNRVVKFCFIDRPAPKSFQMGDSKLI